MKKSFTVLLLCCVATTMSAQNNTTATKNADSTDVFFRHLQLNETVVTGITGDTKLKHTTTPIQKVTARELRQATSTNIIDAIAKMPGVAQITTGGAISKPVIRGLGYNRIVTISDGVRQEGQQWGDEHGIEIDANSVNSVEILKGPASLMYGSDAMAGVLIMQPSPTPAEGERRGSISTEYQTNNGLFNYSLFHSGNERGFVWDARYSGKMSHAYKNKYDGYVPGTQMREHSGRLMLGVNKQWGHSHLILSAFRLQPSIAEGERDRETGELESSAKKLKTYGLTLPFQTITHYKSVLDNYFNLPKGTLKAIVGYQQNRRQEFEEDASDCELYMRLHTLTYDFRYTTDEWNAWKLSAGVGGMWQKSTNHAEETLIPDYSLFDIGGYATVSKSLPKMTLSGGMRIDNRHINYFSRNFLGVTGSVGAVWNVADNMNVRLNMARGFRAPNMSELGSDGVHEGTIRYEIGNHDLKAEYSWQADLGLDFTSKYISAQVAMFANRIDNYIFAQRVDIVKEEGKLTYAYRQGDAQLIGMEAGFDFHPIHSVHFENTLSIVDGRQLHKKDDERYLPMIPAARVISELKYEITHNSDKTFNNAYVALGVESNFPQKHYRKVDNTETATPGYVLLNLSAGSDIKIGKRKVAELYITADNLLDKAYQNHLSRLKYTDINRVTGRTGVFNMGRNFIMKLIVPFNM